MPKPPRVPGRRITPVKAIPEADGAIQVAPEPHKAAQSAVAHEAVEPGTRRRFTAAEKLRLVKAAEAAIASGERGALEALLRREGIYSSHLSTWRRQVAEGGQAGLASRTPGRKPKLDAKGRELVAVTKELEGLK